MSESSERSQRLGETSGAERMAAGPRPATAASDGRTPFERARYALVEWLSHLIAAVGLLLGFHAIEAALNFLGEPNRLSFAAPSLTSLFDAGDAGVIIGFLGYGVYFVLKAYGAESVADPHDVAGASQHGKMASALRLALRPAPATFTMAAFAERLWGQLLVYTVILVASIYIYLFILAPWPVSIGSLGLMLVVAIAGAAVSAPRGSLSGKMQWLVDNRIAAGSFVAAFALLLLIEELLRRSQ